MIDVDTLILGALGRLNVTIDGWAAEAHDDIHERATHLHRSIGQQFRYARPLITRILARQDALAAPVDNAGFGDLEGHRDGPAPRLQFVFHTPVHHAVMSPEAAGFLRSVAMVRDRLDVLDEAWRA